MGEIIGANDPYKAVIDAIGSDNEFEYLSCVRLLDQMGEWLLSHPVGSSVSLAELTVRTAYVKYEDSNDSFVTVECIDKDVKDAHSTFNEMDPMIFGYIMPGIRFNHGFMCTSFDIYTGAVKYLHGAKKYCEGHPDFEFNLSLYFRIRTGTKTRVVPSRKFVSLVRGTMA